MHLFIRLVSISIVMFSGLYAVALAQQQDSDATGQTDTSQRACPGCVVGEVISSYSCAVEGYTIELIKPSSLPAGSNGRIIMVTSQPKEFYAHPNEVAPLGGFNSNPANGYMINSLGFQDRQSPYCDRDGYPLTNTTVYQISQTHAANYNGETNILYDSNLDSYDRAQLVTTFNQDVITPNIDSVPVHCQACRGDVDPVDDDDDGFSPGSYTTADGTTHDLWEIGSGSQGDSPGRPPKPLPPLEPVRELAETFKQTDSLDDEEIELLVETRRAYLDHYLQQKVTARDSSLAQLSSWHQVVYDQMSSIVAQKLAAHRDIDRLQQKIDQVDRLQERYRDTELAGVMKLLPALLMQIEVTLHEHLQDRYQAERSTEVIQDIFSELLEQ